LFYTKQLDRTQLPYNHDHNS